MPRPGGFHQPQEPSETRRKRSHSEFLRSQSRSQSPWTSRHNPRPEMSTSSTTPNFLEPPLQNLAPPVVRWAGDGFDFRRPIMSTDNTGPSMDIRNVIDLTTDDDTSPALSARQLPPLPLPSDRRQRYRDREHTNRSHRQNTRDRSRETAAGPSSSSQRQAAIVREDSDDSDVVFVGQREVSRPGIMGQHLRSGQQTGETSSTTASTGVPRTQGGIGGLGEIIRESTLGLFRNALPMGVFPDITSRRERYELPNVQPFSGRHVFLRALDAARRGYQNHRPEPDFEVMAERQLRPTAPAMHPFPQDFPAQFNFELQGFELNNDFEDDVAFTAGAARNRAESPYKAPSAPPEGFTRTLEEDAIVVCPNCNEELGRRDYDDLKKQVWVVKACGHVYCGECAKNRFTTKAKNAMYSSNVPTFKKCVVDGCEKPVSSRTAMLQIYL